MKNTLTKLFATIFLLAVVVMPLRAQTNVIPTATNNPATSAHQTKLDLADDPPMIATLALLIPILTLLIPIIAIIMACSIPIAIVGLTFYFQFRKNKMLHETLRAMIDKGVPIPPELFQKTENEQKRPRNDLRNGLIFIGIGIGILLLAGRSGCIILFIGVAFVIAAFLEKKNKNDTQPPKQ